MYLFVSSDINFGVLKIIGELDPPWTFCERLVRLQQQGSCKKSKQFSFFPNYQDSRLDEQK